MEMQSDARLELLPTELLHMIFVECSNSHDATNFRDTCRNIRLRIDETYYRRHFLTPEEDRFFKFFTNIKAYKRATRYLLANEDGVLDPDQEPQWRIGTSFSLQEKRKFLECFKELARYHPPPDDPIWEEYQPLENVRRLLERIEAKDFSIVIKMNSESYACPNYIPVRQWYTEVYNVFGRLGLRVFQDVRHSGEAFDKSYLQKKALIVLANWVDCHMKDEHVDVTESEFDIRWDTWVDTTSHILPFMGDFFTEVDRIFSYYTEKTRRGYWVP
ncbi:hypothetical protein BJ508DRAFT_338030 [Ascobolus immersus RN42]|uniref:F-box domain-containing protein n=1 Tax=Ascobolus immersus RN42 TaxID=1160509 RepID=A0A3N4HQP1_ASCIM|nr:hypothetical protein BJ508DRAFT_338030 [Ascobolus immersus RN42]